MPMVKKEVKRKIEKGEEITLLPTNDFVFKKIFGKIGSEKITESLIQDLVGLKDVEVEEVYEDIILEKDILDDKLGVLDVLARTKNDEYINIEMQCGDYDYINDRLTFYLSRTFGMEALRRGDKYENTKRTVAVMICKDKFNLLKAIPNWKTTWHIREDEYKTEVLTNKLEVVIIELGKITEMLFKNQIKTDSKEYIWYKFFLNPNELEEKEMDENEGVKEAKQKYDEFLKDLAEERLALSRQMAIMDKNSLKNEGLKQGDKERKIKVAKKLLNMKMTIEQIIEVTELTKEEVEKIKREL